MSGTYEVLFTDRNGPGGIDRDADSADEAIAITLIDYPSAVIDSARIIYSPDAYFSEGRAAIMAALYSPTEVSR